MIKKNILFGFLLFIGLLTSSHSYATHLRAGEIIVKRVNCEGLTFEITIIVYTDSGPANPVLFGEGELRFGDENDPNEFLTFPVVQNNTAIFVDSEGSTSVQPINEDLGSDVSKATFTIRHTYGSNGKYTVSYLEANRNAGVLNIENGNSINTTFYIETEINIDPFLGCNNTPQLLIPPIDRACPGVAFFHNPGAFDPDGDSISFELVVPKKSTGTNVANYLTPADNSFYENFGSANERADGPPTFTIDPVSGEIEWDAPGRIGEYNIAFIVNEYRFVLGEWRLLGFVTRDMQIIVEDCDNDRPELTIPDDICVEAGESINEIIIGTDPNNDNVKIEAFSQVIEDLGATIDPAIPVFTSPPAQLTFNWETECIDIRDQPYTVVFKITDNPDNGPKLVSFASWNITVVGPSPQLNTVTQDGQGLRLNWDPYFCQNAEAIQIWRRVDTNPYTPDECETGIRENAGYSLVTEVSRTTTTFRDTNLAAGAKYCYRLVARFPDVPGGESIVSQEVCFEFVPAEQPVITHVSVESTSQSNGEILVAWREPFDLGSLTLPLTYRVYRANGFAGTDYQLIRELPPINVLDSVGFRDTGLDTENGIFNYRIAVVDPTGSGGEDEIFSAPASTVRLETTPQFGQIRLDWSAVVPWSNTDINNPVHEIYRGLEGQSQEDFQQIPLNNPNITDVTRFGFTFIDSVDLSDELTYCYRVLTKGTYGNPAINSPQLNYSQIICSQTSDSIPPCTPIISLQEFDCDNRCLNSDFNDTYLNIISWSEESIDNCQNDIDFYELYFRPTITSEPQLLVTGVRDTVYVHLDLSSQKGCYQVRAVDRSGNVGELSELICIDNCPYYELPNVFTPQNGDGCNDTFRAFGAESESCNTDIDNDLNGVRCARFVEQVDFTVYNRWGKPVYNYTGRNGSENSVFIDWDGVGDDGVELVSGVYYYLAEVRFDVVDPSQATQQYKGWVQILR